MYLYLGGDTVINSRYVVGIYDLDNTTISQITKEFLSKSQKEERVVSVTTDLPKSFVVYEKNKETTIYLSQISPATLRKRGRIK